MNTETKPADTLTRAELLQRLERFLSQRPGFDWHNYGDSSSYRADARTATRQLNDGRAMLAAIAWRESITADTIRAELRGSGRLTLQDDGTLDYCTGQYWPTEFRAGVCRVLASLLWDYWRECARFPRMTPEGRRITGDSIREEARLAFGRSIASRWFR